MSKQIRPIASGAELKRVRQFALRLTQAQLAHAIGAHRDTVQGWESGKIAIERPAELALALEAIRLGYVVASDGEGVCSDEQLREC